MAGSTTLFHLPASATAWKRRGWPDLPLVNDRSSLVYGTYEPVANVTAGLRDASLLTDYNDPSTQTVTLPDGAIIRNKTIYGDIRLPSVHLSDIILDNVLCVGGPHVPSTSDAVVKADNTRSGSGWLRMTDSEVSPQKPALNRDGIRGNRQQVERCYIHDTIDGWFGYALSGQNSGQSMARLYGSVIERLRYGYPDYNNGVSGTDPATVTYPAKPADWGHNDGTHNDCVVVGGKDVIVRGNSLRGTGVDLPGAGLNPQHPQIQASGYSYGQCVLITNTGTDPDLTTIVEQNWMYGANAHVNILANMTAILRNNKHYRAVFVGSTSSGYWIRYTLRAGNGVVAENETWVDGPYIGQTLIEPRDKGVSYNA